MRRVENRPAQRASRLTAVPAAVASGPDRGWLVDTKYKPAMTLMIYALLLFMTVPTTVFSQQSNAVVPEPNLLYRTLKLSLLASGLAVLIWRQEMTERLELTKWGFELMNQWTSTCTFGDAADTPFVMYNDLERMGRHLIEDHGAGVAAAHLEDQVMPKRCGHIAGKALISADEFVGKLKMMRAAADDLGHPDFVIIARTDGVSATEAPEPKRGLELAVDRGLRYLDSGVPDLLWCEFPTAERSATEKFCSEIRKRFPKARFAFNYSSSFKWYNEKDPITWDDLGELGVGFIFITLALQHAAGHGMSVLLNDLKHDQEEGYMALQRKEWAAGADIPTRSHHLFTGVPYHQHVGQQYGATRLSEEMDEHLEVSKVV